MSKELMDALELLEPVHVGHGVQGVLPKGVDQQAGGGLPHALDQAGGKKALDAQQGGGLSDLAAGALELPAVMGMVHPGPGQEELFARRQARGWDVWGNEVVSDIVMKESDGID